MVEEDLLKLISEGESEEVECKQAEGGLPNDLWETYSAFANTDGGIILLGIKEKKGHFEVKGIDNHQRIQKDLWDNLNNPKKVSLNILRNQDVQVLEVEGKKVLKIFVPRARRDQRPIYISQNPFGGTFRRNYEGDYKCTPEEIKRMIADQSSISSDSEVLEHYGFEDINLDSLKNYRERFASKSPSHAWLGLDAKEFLYQIGAWGISRETKQEGLTLAGLLMFGKERVITEVLPQYFLDYREKSQSSERWSHRVISSSGTWSGNLYDFYFTVINKLTLDLDVPFRMQGLIRQDDTRVHAALREALVNSIVHADYRGQSGVVVEKSENLFGFSNPGILRIPIKTALRGGISDPRNPLLFKMFNLLGIGERQGAGLANIQLAWKEQYWRTPELIEEYQPERTVLILRTISLLPAKSLEYFKHILREVYQRLNQEEIITLVTAEQETQVTNARLQIILGKHPAEINKLLNSLVNKGFIVAEGQGRGTRYVLSSLFNSINSFKTVEHQINFENQKGKISVNNIDNSVNNNSNSVNNIDNSVNNIDNSVNNVQRELEAVSSLAREKRRLSSEEIKKIILKLCEIKPLALKDLAILLNRNPDGIRNNYLHDLEKEGKIELEYPGVKNHPMQAYRTKK